MIYPKATCKTPDSVVVDSVKFKDLPWLQQGPMEIKASDAIFDHAIGKIRIRYDLSDTSSFQAAWMPGDGQPKVEAA